LVLDKKKNLYKNIKIWDPENLHEIDLDNAWSHQIKSPKNTYYSTEIRQLGMQDRKGKRVRVWRLVKSAFDEMGDIYIPIYYINNKKRIG